MRGTSFWRVLWQYSLFEGADSAWSLIVVSTYFGAFAQVVLGLPAAAFGWTATLASLAIAVASPLLGAMADEGGRRRPYLLLCVAGVVTCTAVLGFTRSGPLALACFALAYVCVSGAFTLFTAMLPAASNAGNVATVVSLSVGVGYASGLACILLFGRLVPNDAAVANVFLPAAAAYAILALPILVAGRDFAPRAGARAPLRAAYRRLRRTLGELCGNTPLLCFLIGNFLAVNASASVITLMGLYSRNVMGFAAHDLARIFGPAIVVAALSAWFGFGPLVRRVGPRQAVLAVLGIWLALFAAVIAVGPNAALRVGPLALDGQALFAVVVAPLAGVALAGMGCTSRVLLTALAPVERSGEIWGLFNLSGRTATIVGDATWSTILTLLGERAFGYHVAVAALAAYVLLGAAFIATVPDVRPTAGNFAQ